ncbi:hypothetical protein H633G_11501 [Metarhizium anisopliae BRIP 53284]|nr:hypothetical protein H633G_11501 [Metarhizium anisopliae BRIP 53284]
MAPKASIVLNENYVRNIVIGKKRLQDFSPSPLPGRLDMRHKFHDSCLGAFPQRNNIFGMLSASTPEQPVHLTPRTPQFVGGPPAAGSPFLIVLCDVKSLHQTGDVRAV